ncbi:hypothetical protein tb265_19390 [Gemmatimonadetes bacterium T265]|nr:hypothetical protein tb265_19390 [Gemmatimonadetes bacterium T265]
MPTAALDVAHAFHAALAAEDWGALRGVFTDDARWILPGDNAVSGPAEGADAVVARARLIATYGMKFDLEHVVASRSNMALLQHNTAECGGRRFDEHVATVCRLRGDRISEIETYVSDLAGFDRFFV